MVEGEMNAAEARSRKGRKAGAGTDRLANAARLGALERYLGVPIKRHRDPGSVGANRIDFNQDGKKEGKQEKDSSTVVMKNF